MYTSHTTKTNKRDLLEDGSYVVSKQRNSYEKLRLIFGSYV